MTCQIDRFKSLGLPFVASLLITSCGSRPDSETLSWTHAEQPGTPETTAVSNWEEFPALSLRSEWQSMSKTSLELKLGVNWVGFGAAVESYSSVRLSTIGNVELVKHIAQSDSKILRDDQGHIDVRSDEPVAGRCQYESESVILVEGSGVMSLAGVRMQKEQGEAKVLSIGSTGKTFDIQDGATLAGLEAHCRDEFESVMRPLVEREMIQAIKTKLRIEQHADSRVNALRAVLQHQDATMEHRGQRWNARPVQIEGQDNAVHISGQLQRTSGWNSPAFDYHYVFDRKSRQLTHVQLAPRGVDEDSRDAMDLSAFVARNAVEWYIAQIEGKSFVIDTKPLPHL